MPKPLIQTTGRRKEAVARVRLRPGTGLVVINGRTIENYFTIASHRQAATEALRITQTADVYDVDCRIDGGGVSGQAGALRLGIARALVALDEETRPSLKKAGLLTRDAARRNGASTGSRRPARPPSTPSADHRATSRAVMTLRFGTDGIRGLANRELTPELVTAVGRAAARVLGTEHPFVVGRDTRRSGPMLEAAVVTGLCAEGADVLLAGVLPTPAVAQLAHARGAPAVMITASHNAYADNGVKIFDVGGRKLTDEVEREVEHELRELATSMPNGPEGRGRGRGVGAAGRPRRVRHPRGERA